MMMTDCNTYGTLCHISDYYRDKNNGFLFGIDIYDNQDLDEPLDCIWFKSESARQKFINEENIIIVEDSDD
jgi:hypothetical protein